MLKFKFLVRNEEEFMSLFAEDIDNRLSTVEDMLDIQFATVHGHFYDITNPDPNWDDDIDDGADINPALYRKYDPETFPQKYPCVVIKIMDKDDYRGHGIEVRFLEYVYLDDFEV